MLWMFASKRREFPERRCEDKVLYENFAIIFTVFSCQAFLALQFFFHMSYILRWFQSLQRKLLYLFHLVYPIECAKGHKNFVYPHHPLQAL